MNRATWWTSCTSPLHIISLGNREQVWLHFIHFDSVSKLPSVWVIRAGALACTHASVFGNVQYRLSERETQQPCLCMTRKLHDNALWASEPMRISSEGACPMKEEVEEKEVERCNERRQETQSQRERERELLWGLTLTYLISSLKYCKNLNKENVPTFHP